MKRDKIGSYLIAVFYLFAAVWLLDFDNPNNLFASFLCFLGFVHMLLGESESEYYRRAGRRLRRVGLVLWLFFLIKLLFSI